MEQNKLQKIFGVGPKGAVISLLLLALFTWADHLLDYPVSVAYAHLIKTMGIILVILGLALHVWSFSTLRHWWADDELCTRGPFAYFRHPMYAAWISLLCPGMALYFNSWLHICWVLLLHPIWHTLVKKEETAMMAIFGDGYRKYTQRTGRFLPRISNPSVLKSRDISG